MTDHIQVTLQDGVQVIRFNRPEKKNALTGDMYTKLANALGEAANSDDIRCSVLLGNEAGFTAGNDIADFLQAATSGAEGIRPVAAFLEALVVNSKPLVAGVDGIAIGVGTTMLMHCDYVVASTNTKLATPFVDLGLVPEAGSSLIAPRIMGHQRAFGLLVMGDEFSAQDGYNAGLVNQVCEPQDLEALTLEAAKKLAAKPPQALKLARDLLRGDEAQIGERVRHEAKLFTAQLSSDEAKQAFMAFMSKGQKKAG